MKVHGFVLTLPGLYSVYRLHKVQSFGKSAKLPIPETT